MILNTEGFLYMLDVGLPLASWLGIIIAAMLTLLGFLLRDAYSSLKNNHKELAKRQEELEKAFEAEKIKQVEAINALRLNILERLDQIKEKFDEFRK